jgi:hypothetical protein
MSSLADLLLLRLKLKQDISQKLSEVIFREKLCE